MLYSMLHVKKSEHSGSRITIILLYNVHKFYICKYYILQHLWFIIVLINKQNFYFHRRENVMKI